MTKYSIKNICLGIGIGLIIGSMVNINTAPNKLTREDIDREAKKLDLIVMDAKDLINKQPEVKPTEQKQAVQPAVTKNNKIVEFNIEAGSASQDVAEKLLNSKLIQNKQDFLNRLSELKKEDKMQIGSFKIPVGSSIDIIIDILTASP
jgi:gas vesicle protein